MNHFFIDNSTTSTDFKIMGFFFLQCVRGVLYFQLTHLNSDRVFA